ncbi:MAG TPA: hypothetical protein EYH05_04055 [Anaerolineae bacterium]|nr:hypothetical protein [Anaerolineae bacterium]
MLEFDQKRAVADLERMQSQLVSALGAATGDGMEDVIRQGLLQLHRFVLSNIEVDTSRTKNSIFPRVYRDGKDVNGRLASNVAYSPWVRDAGHKQHFFEYAADVEGPAVLAMMGREFTLRVKKAFS